MTEAPPNAWRPGFFAVAREWIATTGVGTALALVFLLAWSKALSPLALVHGGMILSLFCGSLTAILIIFNQNCLVGLLIWGAGSLSQQDWSVVAYLAPRVLIAAVLTMLMIRPLSVIGFNDDSARGLDLSLTGTRFAAIALAMLAGARRFRDQLIWAPIIGAVLLWLTDQVVQIAAGVYGDLAPTGALTALFGSPILLWLLPRLKVNAEPPALGAAGIEWRASRPALLLAVLASILVALAIASIAVGRGPNGWSMADFEQILPWRWPRMTAALAAGAMLAVAGTLLQRLTGNPMASPEVLGISAGAALGLVILIFTVPGAERWLQLLAGSIGALLALAGILALTRRSAYSPERLLLVGIALAALFDALVVTLTATGDPRAGTTILAWLTGSTYQVSATDAITTLIAGGGIGAMVPMLVRWASILPLGEPAARAVGVDIVKSRLAILLVTAVLSAAATLIVRLLTFVGLIAPHIARLFGFQRALFYLVAAAIIGALIMVAADWLGRNILFPRQIPAGLIATLIGAPYFMWRMRRD